MIKKESIVWFYDVLGVPYPRGLIFEFFLDIVLEDMKIGFYCKPIISRFIATRTNIKKHCVANDKS
jgi:hypothetical protein